MKSYRIHSIDVFRGITIALMLLVNFADLSPSVHPWLAHSHWNGWTLADVVFPFFLFIVGVSLAFSMAKYEREKISKIDVCRKVFKRSFLLFILGLGLNGFWNYDWGNFELTGVLQRISLAYLSAALVVLYFARNLQICFTALLLFGYWVAFSLHPISEPSFQQQGLSHGEVGTFGVMSYFGMMTTISTVLMGYFTGAWLRVNQLRENCTSNQSMTLVLYGLSSIFASQLWSLLLPINKKIWTSSYILLMVGFALILLAACYELIEVRNCRRWSYPVQILGLNSIFIYVSSELIIKILDKTHVGLKVNSPSTYQWIEHYFFLNWSSPILASFLFSLLNLLFWLGVAYYFNRKKWFLSV